jgi:hypothetical protein
MNLDLKWLHILSASYCLSYLVGGCCLLSLSELVTRNPNNTTVHAFEREREIARVSWPILRNKIISKFEVKWRGTVQI